MKYDSLTKYIEIFQPGYSAGKWILDNEHKGTKEDPIQMPFVLLDRSVIDFVDDFYESGIAVINYADVMEQAGIKLDDRLKHVEFQNLDEETARAILTYVVRTDRFCEGYLKAEIEKGTVTRILCRLRDFKGDESN